MQILVDADACPVVIREILYRAAQKRQLKTHAYLLISHFRCRRRH